MTYSNSILEYYQGIKDGTYTVGKKIKGWYEYIVKGLENKSFYFDQKKANLAIVYIQNFCRHHEGVLAPNKITLELWQKAFVSVLFGIVDAEGNRQFREVVLVVGRKSGKTILASAIASYCAFVDGEYGARIYFTAPKLEQAYLCFDAFYQMVMKEPRLASRAKKRRTDIYIQESNSSIKPLAFSAKKSDGLNVSLGVCDELASWVGDAGLKFYEVLKSSQGARKAPILLSITTAGYVNDGIYDELMKRCTAVLNGSSKETRLAPFIYDIDDIEKWNDITELQKANPNLGVSVSVDYLLEEISIAEASLSKRAEFMTKYCNIKQSSSQAWLKATDVEKAYGDPIDLENFRDCYCVGGIDLSMTTDLTSACIVIEKNGINHIVSKFFLPEEKLEEATARDGLPYDIYIKRGLLTVSGSNIIDYQDVYDWFVELVEKYRIYPLIIGYDRYSSNYLIKDMNSYGFHTTDVYQGFNISPMINEFEGLLKDHRINVGDNDLLKAHLLSTAVKFDAESKRSRIVKINPREHIDGAAAILDALTARSHDYEEIGGMLKNER